ncbi:PHD domain-containing protein [Cephalotus follicularis]|uniref:PHD domain-containing protein n=1 Tax=Cephalotus follicularis TaxID=3775 RepID=A0A1Q3CW11_CEPFO|nr:PHD domain-containing protein [Cephalotus follicularis]
MYAESDEQSQYACREAIPIPEEEKNANYSCLLNFPRSSKLSTVDTMSGSYVPSFVYSRRKARGNSNAIFSARAPTDTKRTGDCISFICSDSPSVAANEQHLVSLAGRETEAAGLCNREHHVPKSECINGCSVVEEHGSDETLKNSVPKIIDTDSINDSCSSSKSNIELASASLKTEVDDPGECSSSSVIVLEVMGEHPSEKDFCISILRSQGLLEGAWPNRTGASSKGVDGNSCGSCSRSCKICGHSETTPNMLICDNCEEAFHMSCCNPRMKKVSPDEWFCHSCFKKKHLKETNIRKSPTINSETGRTRNAPTRGKSNPIDLMLKYTEPYTTSVRIGKGFQADVPHWSGPTMNDVETIGELLEMDPSEYVRLHEVNSKIPTKLSSIGNWLQCREIIEGTGEGVNRTVCGKWRRAPLFEVQRDDWECFCSIFWDPFHADCAVPQELETDQVMKQLKYIEMLRPRLEAKRRKLDHKKSNGSQDNKTL